MTNTKYWIRGLLAAAVLLAAVGASPFAPQPAADAAPLAETKTFLPVIMKHGPARHLGAFLPFLDYTTWASEVNLFESMTGREHAIYPVSNGWDCFWANSISDIYTQLAHIESLGAMPLITWMPMDCTGGGFGDVNALNLQDILNGEWDAYIDEWATDVAALGYPVLVRWGHEMNIPSYSWAGQNAFGADGKTHYTVAAGQGCGLNNCYGANGVPDGPERFRAAYIRVHNRVEAIADNIIWIWNPNSRDWPLASAQPWNQYNNYYPGDAYVDWVALDGYNWGDNSGNGWGHWVTFNEMFGAELADLRNRYPSKPQIIVEIGSVEDPHDPNRKANFIRDAYARAFSTPNLRGMVWVQDDTFLDGLNWCPGGPPATCPIAVDFRLNSSPQALQAYKDSIGQWASHPPYP